MSNPTQPTRQGDSLAARIRQSLGVKLSLCHQCGKCSARCPVAKDMDLTSSQILGLLQLADPVRDREALACEGIWLCRKCATCANRCPQEVDITRVMDFLRSEAVRLGLAHPRS